MHTDKRLAWNQLSPRTVGYKRGYVMSQFPEWCKAMLETHQPGKSKYWDEYFLGFTSGINKHQELIKARDEGMDERFFRLNEALCRGIFILENDFSY